MTPHAIPVTNPAIARLARLRQSGAGCNAYWCAGQGEPAGDGRLLTWKSGDLRLQVSPTNRIDRVWRFADFEGNLAVSFWSVDYKGHLANMGERCANLLEEKRGRGV